MMHDQPAARAARLQAIDVSFSYGRTPILGGVDCTFETGSLTAITGPSGRGKSTLLYLLGLLLTPDAGAVALDGLPVADLPDAARSRLRARRIGFVFQDAALDATRSVIDNVMEGALYAGLDRGSARRRAEALLEHFGVELRSAARPGEVSGGQAQRIALCRAMLTAPSVLLADEPTGNLDKKNSATVIDALRLAGDRGAAVVIATHDPAVVRQCDAALAL